MSTAPLPETASHTSVQSAQRVATTWDLPLRLFHWSLLACVATAIISGEIGGDAMDLHALAGESIIGLLAFRIIWGFVGSPTSRFVQFFPTPARVRKYLKGQWLGRGHNPLGAFSVLAMLGILTAQAITGLFSNDDISFEGPWYGLVSAQWSHVVTGLHHRIAFVLFGLLALHILAVLFYLYVRRKNLILPMITGKAQSAETDHAHAPVHTVAHWRWAFGIAVAVIVALGAGGKLGGEAQANPAAAKASPAASHAGKPW